MEKQTALSYGPLPEHLMDLYLPDGPARALLLWFHGGGLEAGSRADCAPYAAFLARRGIAVACGDYRMYPGAHFPEYVQDAALCAAFVLGETAPALSVRQVFAPGFCGLHPLRRPAHRALQHPAGAGPGSPADPGG